MPPVETIWGTPGGRESITSPTAPASTSSATDAYLIMAIPSPTALPNAGGWGGGRRRAPGAAAGQSESASAPTAWARTGAVRMHGCAAGVPLAVRIVIALVDALGVRPRASRARSWPRAFSRLVSMYNVSVREPAHALALCGPLKGPSDPPPPSRASAATSPLLRTSIQSFGCQPVTNPRSLR